MQLKTDWVIVSYIRKVDELQQDLEFTMLYCKLQRQVTNVR